MMLTQEPAEIPTRCPCRSFPDGTYHHDFEDFFLGPQDTAKIPQRTSRDLTTAGPKIRKMRRCCRKVTYGSPVSFPLNSSQDARFHRGTAKPVRPKQSGPSLSAICVEEVFSALEWEVLGPLLGGQRSWRVVQNPE